MFDSLSDRIKQDELQGVSRAQRIMRWVAIAVVSVGVFGGLIVAVRFFSE